MSRKTPRQKNLYPHGSQRRSCSSMVNAWAWDSAASRSSTLRALREASSSSRRPRQRVNARRTFAGPSARRSQFAATLAAAVRSTADAAAPTAARTAAACSISFAAPVAPATRRACQRPKNAARRDERLARTTRAKIDTPAATRRTRPSLSSRRHRPRPFASSERRHRAAAARYLGGRSPRTIHVAVAGSGRNRPTEYPRPRRRRDSSEKHPRGACTRPRAPARSRRGGAWLWRARECPRGPRPSGAPLRGRRRGSRESPRPARCRGGPRAGTSRRRPELE
mmetsp:Transcript_34580/g.106288  ORF Transcript_34580/g.106288 Transcript_34580/m.106288 type:complete len:281 (+) Transcript_34580:432-1274(+)